MYGAEWDGSETTVWTRTDDATGFDNPVPYVNGATNYSSPFDGIWPWAGMYRVTDSEAGELVAIPKYWYKWTKTGDTMKLQISPKAQEGFYVSPAHADRDDGKGERDVVYVGRYHCGATAYKSVSGQSPKVSITRATARTEISNLGTTIWQFDYAMYWTIAMLYLVEFADWDSQKVIGYGGGNGSSIQAVGASDTMPYHTGTMQSSRTTYGVGCQYRWIEGLWENARDFVDGIFYSGTDLASMRNPAHFSDTSYYVTIGSRITSSGVISEWSIPDVDGFGWALYPSEVSGSVSTYVADFANNSASGVALASGGGWSHKNQDIGLFSLNGTIPINTTYNNYGCRLQKLP